MKLSMTDIHIAVYIKLLILLLNSA